MKSFYHILLLSLLCLPSFAQTVVLSDPNQAYSLFERFSVLEVKPGTVTIDSLLQHPDTYRFTPIKRKALTVGHSYWLRLELTNPTPELFALRIFLLSFNRMVLYETDGKRVLNQRDLTLFPVTDTTDFFQHSKRMWPMHMSRSQTHTIYLYIDQIRAATLPIYAQSNGLLLRESHHEDLFYGFYYGFVLIVIVYSLILFVRLGDRDNLLYAIWVFLTGLSISLSSGQGVELFPTLHNLHFIYTPMFGGLVPLIHLLFLLSFLSLRQIAKVWYRIGLGLVYLLAILVLVYLIWGYLLRGELPNNLFLSVFASYIDAIYSLLIGIVAYRRGFRLALYAIAGILVVQLSWTVYIMMALGSLPFNFWTLNGMVFGGGLEILLFTLAMGGKVNLLKKHQDEAIQEQLRLTKENQQLVESQNRVLEEKVEQRTAELQESLTTLQATQAQLIQKEKLASLGELTAGIAHEIQNPLNFVNNFSEVSTELIEEQKEALAKGDVEEAGFIADDLAQNLEKITLHGKRAGSIVRGMLEHSRTSTGEKQPTNLNTLADEYLRLAYQGLLAKDKGFNADLKMDFAADLPSVSVVGQEIGRVLLNLYNNAFYAVHQRANQAEADYQPTVWVSTRQEPGQVVLCVRDNGSGIPDAIKEKIFQPFFTTKPTGEGTGLGLSLSYDIITKGHGGTMAVESREGEGAEFVITLPC